MNEQLKAIIVLIVAAIIYSRYRVWANKRDQRAASTDNQRVEAEPSPSNDVGVGSQATAPADALDVETLFALKTGAMFLFVNVAIRILGMASRSIVVILEGGNVIDLFTFDRIGYMCMEFLAGYMLWKGNLNWRSTAIAFTVAIFIGGILKPLAAIYLGSINLGIILSLVGYLFFIIALSLTISGQASRKRTWLGMGIYAVGYIGLSIIGGFLVIISNL